LAPGGAPPQTLRTYVRTIPRPCGGCRGRLFPWEGRFCPAGRGRPALRPTLHLALCADVSPSTRHHCGWPGSSTRHSPPGSTRTPPELERRPHAHAAGHDRAGRRRWPAPRPRRVPLGADPPWANDPSVGTGCSTPVPRPWRQAVVPLGLRRAPPRHPRRRLLRVAQDPGGSRQPYFFRRADGAPVVFAGLYEFWRDPTIPDGAHPWVRFVHHHHHGRRRGHGRHPRPHAGRSSSPMSSTPGSTPTPNVRFSTACSSPLRAARWHAWRWIGAWATSPTTARAHRRGSSGPRGARHPLLSRRLSGDGTSRQLDEPGTQSRPCGGCNGRTGRRPPATLTTRT